MTVFESWTLAYLLNSLWQVPLLFVVAWLAARALRPAGPATEHRVWVAALLLEALLPACSAQPFAALGRLSLWSHPAPTADPNISVVMGPATRFGALHLAPPLLAIVTAVYLAVLLYFAARLLWSAYKIAVLRRGARPTLLTGDAALSWTRCSARFNVPNPAIALSDHVSGPVTIGIRHKLILLPAPMFSGLAPEELHTVIAHEFAHMHRHDILKHLLYELVALPAMYHPIFLLTRSRLVESREMICDELAADAGSGRERYARSLLRLASTLVNGAPLNVPNAIGIFDANAFERRIMNLTQHHHGRSRSRRLATLAACAAIGLATCASALALRLNVYAPAGLSNAAAKDSSVKVPGGVMAGNLLTRVNPVYPESAKKAKIQGSVVLHAVVSKEGIVENLEVVSGPDELRASSLDAVRQWTYKPYLVNGEPVEIETTVQINYSLQP